MQCPFKVGAIDAAALGPFKKCDFSGWYNFWKIIKIVAARCHIVKLKCTKFDFGWSSAPDLAGGAYSALPDRLAGLKGPTSEGNEAREMGRGRKGKGLRSQSEIHLSEFYPQYVGRKPAGIEITSLSPYV